MSKSLGPFCSELKREKAWSRIHLVPLILAEADRDAYRREQAQIAREKEIMKDVPDWKVSRRYIFLIFEVKGADSGVWLLFYQAGQSVYNTKRYTPANFIVI